jgi:hypothetical protein
VSLYSKEPAKRYALCDICWNKLTFAALKVNMMGIALIKPISPCSMAALNNPISANEGAFP